jgi:hypothetical protein
MGYTKLLTGAAIAALLTAAPALALNDDEAPDYLIMEPNAEVVFITTGGAEVRADWTAQAKENLFSHFDTQVGEQGFDTVAFDADAERNDQLDQLLLLYEVVAQHAGDNMPHKGGVGSNMDLTLGSDAALLGDTYDSDYAVFIDHYSQIESGGVFMTQVMIGVATGYTPPSQNIRLTAGTVIDLQTGDLVDREWVVMGDPRDVDESANIVSRIMNNLDLAPVEETAE